ncbi:MAG: cystatin domain-containing protein [Actinomycetota bacterium]
MKLKLSIFIACAVLFVFWSGSTVCYGQEEPIAGGYANADVANTEVIAAAKFAVKKRSKSQKAAIGLLSIKNARIQVVAGLNYELCLWVNFRKKNQKAVEQFVKVVVYRNLKNAFSLTGWLEENCAEK